jgi:RNA polymerase sigma-70 factor (ECF subfamily)
MMALLDRRSYLRMYAIARRILGNDAEAEDAVQEAYLRALQCRDQFAGRSSFLTWLTRIVVNEALGRMRRQRRFPTFDVSEAFGENEGVIFTSHLRSPEQEAMENETKRRVATAVGALPEKYRSVLVMTTVEELPGSAVGRRLGITEACVKTRLHRARGLLREHLSARRLAVAA